MDDTDDISRARKLARLVDVMPLPKADKAILGQALALFVDSYHHGYRIVTFDSPVDSDASRARGFGRIGEMTRGL